MAGDVGHESGRTTDDEYIYRPRGGVHGANGEGWRGRVGDSVNGILLGHPFTRTRRKLEDLIWRAVWIAFALAMPPIEPSVIYVHIHTYYAHLYTDRREYEHASAHSYACTHTFVYAVYTKEQFTRKRSSFVRSFVRSFARAYVSRVCAPTQRRPPT